MDSFKDLHLGLFVHYTYFDITRSGAFSTTWANGSYIGSLDELAYGLDIPNLVQTAVSMRAQYVIFTTFHSNMNVLYPSAVMAQYLPNHSSKRDIIAELSSALKQQNIKLVLYFHPSDGGDFTLSDQNKVGWNDGAPYTRWNNFINLVLAEVVDRYGQDVIAYFMDGGIQPQVDYPRLRKTIKDRYSSAWIMQNGNGVSYNASYADSGISEMEWKSPYPAVSYPRGLLISNTWWATGGGVVSFSPELAYLNTVLQASVTNRIGGGIAWAFSPYPNGIWETGAMTFCEGLANYVDEAGESLLGTQPSHAYPTQDGKNLTDTIYCATESLDGRKTYIHIFQPPSGPTFTLPLPSNYIVFNSAYLTNSKHDVNIVQNEYGVFLTLNASDNWDSLDTVITLSLDAKPIDVSVSTIALSSVTPNTAVSGGIIANSIGSNITGKGICWATDTDQPTINNAHTIDGSGSTSFISQISGLTANTRYFVRAYVIINGSTVTYGNSIQLYTLSNTQNCTADKELVNGSCVPLCQWGYIRSGSNCIPDPTPCSLPYFHKNEYNICVAYHCPDGYHIDNKYCVDNSTPCPQGYHPDAYGDCVKDNINCPEGQNVDTSGACVPIFGNCRPGYHNTSPSTCEPNITACGIEGYPDEIFPPLLGTPCDVILENDPHRCPSATNATGLLNNAIGNDPECLNAECSIKTISEFKQLAIIVGVGIALFLLIKKLEI